MRPGGVAGCSALGPARPPRAPRAGSAPWNHSPRPPGPKVRLGFAREGFRGLQPTAWPSVSACSLFVSLQFLKYGEQTRMYLGDEGRCVCRGVERTPGGLPAVVAGGCAPPPMHREGGKRTKTKTAKEKKEVTEWPMCSKGKSVWGRGFETNVSLLDF